MRLQSVGFYLARIALVGIVPGIAVLYMWFPQILQGGLDTVPEKVHPTEDVITVQNFSTKHCIHSHYIQNWTGDFKVKRGIDMVENLDMESDEERKNLFQKIFDEKIWMATFNIKKLQAGYEDVQSSGVDALPKRTRKAERILETAINRVKRELGKDVIRLLDIACGDMVWMNEFLKSRHDIEYVGMDIVPDLIEKHKQRYKNMTNWTFIEHDIVKSEINGWFDLIFSRHMTVNMQTSETIQTLKHFSSAGSYLLISDYPTAPKNYEIDMTQKHRWVEQNLSIYPYKLTPPLCLGEEVHQTWLALHKLPLHQVYDCKETNFPYLKHTFTMCV